MSYCNENCDLSGTTCDDTCTLEMEDNYNDDEHMWLDDDGCIDNYVMTESFWSKMQFKLWKITHKIKNIFASSEDLCDDDDIPF